MVSERKSFVLKYLCRVCRYGRMGRMESGKMGKIDKIGQIYKLHKWGCTSLYKRFNILQYSQRHLLLGGIYGKG
jgi:hypothetical protein